jgi:hypothetical protein
MVEFSRGSAGVMAYNYRPRVGLRCWRLVGLRNRSRYAHVPLWNPFNSGQIYTNNMFHLFAIRSLHY